MKRQLSETRGRRPTPPEPRECTACPFYTVAGGTCLAGIPALPVSSRRKALCTSEDHDLCPTYLGYLLRRSRPMRVDCDWLDA